jgi:hypothetical protein
MGIKVVQLPLNFIYLFIIFIFIIWNGQTTLKDHEMV